MKRQKRDEKKAEEGSGSSGTHQMHSFKSEERRLESIRVWRNTITQKKYTKNPQHQLHNWQKHPAGWLMHWMVLHFPVLHFWLGLALQNAELPACRSQQAGRSNCSSPPATLLTLNKMRTPPFTLWWVKQTAATYGKVRNRLEREAAINKNTFSRDLNHFCMTWP